MAAERKSTSGRRSRPPRTTEAKQQELIGLAMDWSEKKLRDGTAPAQVVTHFLKQGSERERLELLKLSRENELLNARVAQIEAETRTDELYAQALRAMRRYSGQEELEEDDWDEYDDEY